MCQVAFLNGLYHSYVLLISWTAAGGIGKALLLFISPALLSYILCCYRCYTHAIRYASLLDRSQQVITVGATGRHMFDLFFPSLLTWVRGVVYTAPFTFRDSHQSFLIEFLLPFVFSKDWAESVESQQTGVCVQVCVRASTGDCAWLGWWRFRSTCQGLFCNASGSHSSLWR